eukprot:gene18462-13283_t
MMSQDNFEEGASPFGGSFSIVVDTFAPQDSATVTPTKDSTEPVTDHTTETPISTATRDAADPVFGGVEADFEYSDIYNTSITPSRVSMEDNPAMDASATEHHDSHFFPTSPDRPAESSTVDMDTSVDTASRDYVYASQVDASGYPVYDPTASSFPSSAPTEPTPAQELQQYDNQQYQSSEYSGWTYDQPASYTDQRGVPSGGTTDYQAQPPQEAQYVVYQPPRASQPLQQKHHPPYESQQSHYDHSGGPPATPQAQQTHQTQQTQQTQQAQQTHQTQQTQQTQQAHQTQQAQPPQQSQYSGTYGSYGSYGAGGGQQSQAYGSQTEPYGAAQQSQPFQTSSSSQQQPQPQPQPQPQQYDGQHDHHNGQHNGQYHNQYHSQYESQTQYDGQYSQSNAQQPPQ